MNTIQDLRSTLDREARALHDDNVVARTVAVRGRVRTVRRRRAAAVVAAAAVAVAGVAVGVTTGSDGPAPAAQRRLVGQAVPAEMTSLGWTYAFGEGTEGDGTARLRLESSDQPRLVTWATAGEDQSVTVQRSPERPWPSSSADFADFTVVHPGFDGRVSVTGNGPVAVAVYELTDEAPDGYTRGGVTFREDVGGDRLLEAVVGEPGVAELELEVTPGTRRLALPTLCTGGPRGTWTHLAINGEEVTWGPGCDDGRFDPGAGGFETSAGAGPTTGLRLWVTEGEDGPLVSDDSLLLGLGVYEVEPASARAARQRVDELIERDGHLWRLVDTTTGEVGQRELVVPAHAAPETLVATYFTSLGGATAFPVRNGRRTDAGFAGGTGSTFAGILYGEGTAGARISGEPGPRAQLGLARYERVD
jgi:hypothetical protein